MRFLVQSSSSGRRIARKPRRRHPFGRGGASRKLSFEAFEARHLLSVTLTWSGPGNPLSLTEGSSSQTPAVVISEPTTGVNTLEVNLESGYTFAAGSTTSVTGLSYQNAGSPTTSQYATIDISSAGNVASLVATLPGDGLTLGPIWDLNGGVKSISASAGSIQVAGISTTSANGNVSLAATGDLTVDAGAAVQSGNGTISLAADVQANGTGYDGAGTLSIGAGAVVDSTNPTASAITLRGAYVNIDTGANPAWVGALPSLSTTPTATLTGMEMPDCLVFDSRGNLYAANLNGNRGTTVSKFAPGATTPTATLSGLDIPYTMAIDSSDNLYVSNWANSTVSKFVPGATTPTATLTGVMWPDFLAVDSSGDLYVANLGAGTVSKFAPGATTPTTLTGLSGPASLAFDSSGDLFVANYNNNTVSEFAPGATTPTATLTGVDDPNELVVDCKGDLFVGNCDPDGTDTTVSEFAPHGTTPFATLTGVNWPQSMVFDANDNLYVGNYQGSTVSEFAQTMSQLAGGVVIRSSLPSRPMSIGGTNNAVAGINLTDAELAQIATAAVGTVTFGDSSQTGNIIFTTATPSTTPGASIRVVQSPSGPGQVVLDDAGNGTGLNGNGGSVTLSPGTGGIVVPLSAAGVPLAVQGFNANGLILTPTLRFAPTLGTQLTLIDNTASPPARHPITGTLANLPLGGTIAVAYGGTTYWFQANYGGGDGNDLVLTAINSPGVATTTTLTTSQASITYGTVVTFTATVAAESGAAAPSGSMEFFDGNTELGSGTPASPSGVTQSWTFTTPDTTQGRLQVGNGQIITAVYTPLAGFSASRGTTSQSVAPVASAGPVGYAMPMYAPASALARDGGVSPMGSTAAPTGMTPTQICQAYGFNTLSFGSTAATGAGTTIAIVDAYDDPNIASDLHSFDQYFGLPDPPSFTKVNQTGGSTPSATDDVWATEIVLDVQWSHAVAPGANILLVEANSDSDSDLYTAVSYASHTSGVVAVSMSWGGSESSGETAYDSDFTTPSGHPGVTFLASSGDDGAPPSNPAASPNVVSVGGTSLYLTAQDNYSSESGWSGSGGGVSSYES
jgi:hypothetical protein